MEFEKRASEWMKWSAEMIRKKLGGRCPKCLRDHATGLFQGRTTCAHCRWCETD